MKHAKFAHPRGQNLQMNDHTYAMRRKVMDVIYEARKLATLPRITVRIGTPGNENVLGTASLVEVVIWINVGAFDLSPLQFRHTVLHEICHTAFGTEHDETCSLMASTINRTSQVEQDAAFIRHSLNG